MEKLETTSYELKGMTYYFNTIYLKGKWISWNENWVKTQTNVWIEEKNKENLKELNKMKALRNL